MIATNVQSKSAQPTMHLMTVTPEMALNWLEHANTCNRQLSEKYAQRLARDIKAGQWVLTHEGIAFDPNGVLLDGQHRLWAIALANMPVQMHVWFNITRETLMVMNNGRVRGLADNLRLGGGLGEVTKTSLSTLRAMLGGGCDDTPLTPSEAKILMLRHADAIAFAVQHIPKLSRIKGLSTGETRAVLARAFYSADHGSLLEFCEILRTSVCPSEQAKTVITLRDYLTTSLGASRALRQERYAKTERVLMAFLRGERLVKLYAVGKELFPLPEEVS